MDIQALIPKAMAFAFCSFCIAATTSCSDAKVKTEQQQQVDTSAIEAIEERRKAIELAYEYELFVNKIWQDLNLLSDNLTELQTNRETYASQTRRSKMASIENNLNDIEKRLREAENNAALNEGDKRRILELRKAIKRKDKTIQKLKKEVETLKDENTTLQVQLQGASQEIENKRLELENQKRSASSYVEQLGDDLRNIIVKMDGVNGSGFYAPLKKGQIKIIEACIFCYRKANSIYPSSHLQEKLKRTERGLYIYRNSKDLSELDF